MSKNFDLNVIRERKNELVKGLFDDIVFVLEPHLDEKEKRQLAQKVTSQEKISLLLDFILETPHLYLEPFKQRLREAYSWYYEYFQLDSTLKILTKGGVPALAPRNVTRSGLVETVRNELHLLTGNKYLVLHGLIGCGKTSLATEALHDDKLVQKVFQGHVYWLTVGFDGLNQINKLQEDLNARLQQFQDQNLSPNPQLAVISLRQRYMESRKDCLIVLDDVHDEKVIEQLNVGVRFLITTQNKNIIKKNLAITKFIKVNDGFEEEESFELFACSLDMKIKDLPKKQPKKIHKLCKGHPLTIALIGAQLSDHKEDVKKGSSSRWDRYVEVLSDPQRTKKIDEEIQGYMTNAIKFALESLPAKQKSYFEHFVLFPHDVNLKPEVLATVWSMEKHEVEDLMVKFAGKSLVVRMWNETLDSYVYGVHDLFLDYLNSAEGLQPEKIKNLHKELIEKYNKKSNYDMAKLPNDNYIFYYLGRHLKLAGMEHKFSKIYMDLKFLEAKLHAVELVDLELDFERYKDFIKQGQKEEDVKNVCDFLESYGPQIHNGLDIAQLALQEDQSSYVYKAGTKLVDERLRLGNSYITFPYGPVGRKDWLPRSINTKDKVTAICFTESNSHIVIATQDNSNEQSVSLKLLSSKGYAIKKYTGHNNAITRILINSSGNKLITSSVDHTVKIWNFDLTTNGGRHRTPSPGRIQDSHFNFWNYSKLGDEAFDTLLLEGPVLWIAIPPLKSDSRLMASVTYNLKNNKRYLVVSQFKIDMDIVYNSLPNSQSSQNESYTSEVSRTIQILWTGDIDGLKLCEFSIDSQEIFTAGDFGVEIFDVKSFTISKKIESVPVIGLSVLQSTYLGNLVTVSDTSLNFWKRDPDQDIKLMRTIKEDSGKIKIRLFHCSDYFIILATERNDIIVLDKETGLELERIEGNQHLLMNIAVKSGKIMAVYEDNSIELKMIDMINVQSKICWPKDQKDPYTAKVENSLVLKVMHGTNNVLMKREGNIPITKIAFFCENDQKLVAYATTHANIFLVKNCAQPEQIEFEFKDSVNFIEFAKYKNTVWLLAGSKSICVKVFDTKSNFPSNIRPFSQETSGAESASLTSHGALILSKGKTIQVLDFTTKAMLYKLENYELMAVNDVKSYFIASDGKKVEMINARTHEIIWTESHPDLQLASFSPEGSKAALVWPYQLLVKDCNDFKTVKSFNLPRKESCHRFTNVAVTEEGIVCISANQPQVLIIPMQGKMVQTALQVSNLIASSFGAFASIDRSGNLHILHLESKFSNSNDCFSNTNRVNGANENNLNFIKNKLNLSLNL